MAGKKSKARPEAVLGDDGILRVTFEMPADLQAKLDKSRARWAELKAAGTPYWCVHEGREVDHPSAYWWPDTPSDAIYRSHGVRCSECGGYIQVG